MERYLSDYPRTHVRGWRVVSGARQGRSRRGVAEPREPARTLHGAARRRQACAGVVGWSLKASTILTVTVAAAAALASLPATAAAGCPGCEEYTLDIPEDEPAPAPAPAPAPEAAPAPVGPAVPAAPVTPTTPEADATAVATETAPGAEPDAERDKPKDPDEDPVPGGAVKPAALANVPAVAASRASDLESSSPGGVLPLAIAMVAVAIAGAALSLARRRDDAQPEP